MKVLNYLITFIALLSLSFSSQAADIRAQERYILQDLKFEMQFHNLILKVADEIDREMDHIPLSEIETQKMEDIYRQKVLRFADFYEQHYEIPKSKMQKIKNFLTKEVRWSDIPAAFKKSNLGLQVFFKRNGIGLALAIFLGYLSDVLVLAAAGALGMTKLLAISPFIPYALIYSALPTISHKLVMRSKLIKKLGGKIPYKAYLEQLKISAQHLKLGDPYRWFFPSQNYLVPLKTHGKFVDAVVIPKNSKFAGLAGKLGLDIKALNYNTISVFLTTHGIKSDFISWVTDNESLQRWQKVALIVDHIIHTQPEEVVQSMQRRFSESFVRVDKPVPTWNGLKSWTKKMTKAKNPGQVKKLIMEVPDYVSAMEIMTLWEEIILPAYAEKKDFSYSEYRGMVRETELLRAKAQSSKGMWDEGFKQEFIELIARCANKPQFSTCANGHDEVLMHLIRKSLKY